MGGSATVRRGRPGDVDGVYRVTRRNWETAFAEFLHPGAVDWDVETPAEYREWFRTVLDDAATRQLVAVAGGAVVGSAEFAWPPAETAAVVAEGEAELRAIHVDPDRWGEGVGSRLLARGSDALPDDRSGIALSVLADNDRARAFYERRGFERDGTTRTTIGGEAYVEAVYRRSR